MCNCSESRCSKEVIGLMKQYQHNLCLRSRYSPFRSWKKLLQIAQLLGIARSLLRPISTRYFLVVRFLFWGWSSKSKIVPRRDRLPILFINIYDPGSWSHIPSYTTAIGLYLLKSCSSDAPSCPSPESARYSPAPRPSCEPKLRLGDLRIPSAPP